MASEYHPSKFAEEVGAARKRAKMSYARLADLSNLSKSYVFEIEKGTVSPSLSAACRVAHALNISFKFPTDFMRKTHHKLSE